MNFVSFILIYDVKGIFANADGSIIFDKILSHDETLMVKFKGI